MHLNHLIPTNTDFLVWDAVFAWRGHIDKKNALSGSKASYITGMRKLYESDIINVKIKLESINQDWLNDCYNKIDALNWSEATKQTRKSCLSDFFKFIENDFDKSATPYQRHPKGNEIIYVLSNRKEPKEKYEKLEKTVMKHVLSSVVDVEKVKARDVCPIVLCNKLSKINERDAYIVWLMMYAAQPLEKVLDLKKDCLKIQNKSLQDIDYTSSKTYGAYIYFDNSFEYVYGHVVDQINKICEHSKIYLFETEKNKRITRVQITRNLKKAGKMIGLDFNLTPKILYGYVCAHLTEDKRSEIAKGLGLPTC